MQSAPEFEKQFTQRFGKRVWLVGFDERSPSLLADIEFVDGGDDVATFLAWTDPHKNMTFRVNPKNVMEKSNQWEVVEMNSGRRWAIRTPRPDQEARRG